MLHISGLSYIKIKSFVQNRYFRCYYFFYFISPAKNEEYSKLNRNPAVNVAAFYNKKLAYNGKNNIFGTGPDFYGISGCCLWYTDPSHLVSGVIKPKLTAIMTDWPVKNRYIIIGTSIDVITGLIKKYVNLDFPESRIVRVH